MTTERIRPHANTRHKLAAISLGVALLLSGCIASAHAGPWNWLRDLFVDDKDVPERVHAEAEGPVPLTPGKSLRIQLGPAAPRAKLPNGNSRYRRFTLPSTLENAVVRVRVLVQHHDESPRFTAMAPMLHLLDADGNIRQSVAIKPLRLAIDPFRPAELSGCLQVQNLRSFLLAADVAKVGDNYSYDARTRGGSYPDRGFYRSGAAIQVYLTYAKVGELVLWVTPIEKNHPRCSQWQE